MKLTPRLKTIADLVEPNHRVADVGTDHGYIPVYLIENGHKCDIIASDINEGPLNNAKETIAENNMEGSIETRLGGGLEPYQVGEVETVIIAGMGGILISKILEASDDVARSAKKIILQPMQKQAYLRKWLSENNYVITHEKLAQEAQRYYEILIIETGKPELKEDIYNEIGYLLPENEDPLFNPFLDHKIRKYKIILEKMQSEVNEDSVKKRKAFTEILEKLEEIKTCVSIQKI